MSFDTPRSTLVISVVVFWIKLPYCQALGFMVFHQLFQPKCFLTFGGERPTLSSAYMKVKIWFFFKSEILEAVNLREQMRGKPASSGLSEKGWGRVIKTFSLLLCITYLNVFFWFKNMILIKYMIQHPTNSKLFMRT